jgi:hypothetical protein
MINILVVIYKKTFLESETLMKITDVSRDGILKQSKLIVWDNSPQKIDETDLYLLKDYFSEVILIHTPENLPLSKIYNNVINNYLKIDDYLVLLDHDTHVTHEYFKEIIDKVGSVVSSELLLPKIVVKGKIESPAYQYVLFSKRWKLNLAGMYRSNNVTAINSGMVISARFLLSGFKYDERLLFYGTDSYMMYNYSRYCNEFYLLNSEIEHDLNLQSNPSIIQKVKIFKEIKEANLIVYSSNIFHSILTRINNLIITVKYAIKYKSLMFFK